MYVYTPLVDFNPEQIEKRGTWSGHPCCSCLCKNYIFMCDADEVLFSICADLCGCLCMCMCVSNMHSALLLAEPGHRETQQPPRLGVSRWSNLCVTSAIFCLTPECPLWISWHMATKMTTQLILLRITVTPLTAGQISHILKEHIPIVISDC